MKNINVVAILDLLLHHCLAQKDKTFNSAPTDGLKKTLGHLTEKLEEQGFTKESIQNAFTWFFNLLLQQTTISREDDGQQHCDAIRIFSTEEIEKIGSSGCSFLLSLQETGILTPKLREIVITQLMHLPQSVCTPSEAKWVVFIVLLSQNNKENVPQLLEKYSLYLM